MTILNIISLIVALVFFLSGFLNMFMFYYLSRKHMKILDKIVYHREFNDDNYILTTMRIGQYLVVIFVNRIRKQLPEDEQKKIVALDSEFRRPFKILILTFVMFFTSILISEILEKFYGIT